MSLELLVAVLPHFFITSLWKQMGNAPRTPRANSLTFLIKSSLKPNAKGHALGSSWVDSITSSLKLMGHAPNVPWANSSRLPYQIPIKKERVMLVQFFGSYPLQFCIRF